MLNLNNMLLELFLVCILESADFESTENFEYSVLDGGLSVARITLCIIFSRDHIQHIIV